MADMHVATVRRDITITLTPEEALEIKQWFDDLPMSVKVKANGRPHLLSELYGGLSAIAQHREYGGH